jgi:hypothetical protein
MLVSLPLSGPIDRGALSLPVLTVALAALDAFTCASFVLLFLPSLAAMAPRA